MNKKAKNIINTVLIVFVVGSAAYLVADQILSKPQPAPVQTPTSQPAQPTQAQPQPAEPDEQPAEKPPSAEKPPPQENEPSAKEKAVNVVLYYFYGNVRCPTCRKFETYTKKALDEAFSGGSPTAVSGTSQSTWTNPPTDTSLTTIGSTQKPSSSQKHRTTGR